MDADRSDFSRLLEEKAKKRTQQAMPAYRALQAAGVIMAKLTTGSDEWNRYLSYLQGQIEKTRERVEVARAKQEDPSIWDVSERNKLKADILQGNAMIAAWELAMQLPKALIEGGQEATEFLNKLERENAKDTAQAQS